MKQLEHEKLATISSGRSELCDHWGANFSFGLFLQIVPKLGALGWLGLGFQAACKFEKHVVLL